LIDRAGGHEKISVNWCLALSSGLLPKKWRSRLARRDQHQLSKYVVLSAGPLARNLTFGIYQSSSKKRKLVGERKKPQPDGPRKQKLADRGIIPIPINDDEAIDDDELSEADAALLDEFGGAVDFLKNLDKKGIMRCVCHMWHCIIVPQFM
jgi:hypothetical protein